LAQNNEEKIEVNGKKYLEENYVKDNFVSKEEFDKQKSKKIEFIALFKDWDLKIISDREINLLEELKNKGYKII